MTLKKHKGDKGLSAWGQPGMLHCAGGWLTGRSLADEGGEITLIIPQLPSNFHVEIKPKEENYWQQCQFSCCYILGKIVQINRTVAACGQVLLLRGSWRGRIL